MNKKKLLCLILSAVLCSALCCISAEAVIPEKKAAENADIEECTADWTEAAIIKRAGLRNKFRKSDEEQIADLFKKYTKYAENNKFEKLKELYSDDFISNDSFDKQTVFKIMESSADIYKNIKYNTIIDNIKISGKYASVRAYETAEAETGALSAQFSDTGSVHSESEYINGLVKEGNKWKILTTEVLSEKVTVKYGEAKQFNMDITAPDAVSAGASYDITVTAGMPETIFAICSINNEKIVYPQENKKEVFRRIKNGQLTRVLNADTLGNNEYASASIALTRAEVKSMQEVKLNITGAAFLMKRINVMNTAEKKETAENGAVSK